MSLPAYAPACRAGQVSAGGDGEIRSQSSVEVSVKWAPDMLGVAKQEAYLVIKMVGGGCRSNHSYDHTSSWAVRGDQKKATED